MNVRPRAVRPTIEPRPAVERQARPRRAALALLVALALALTGCAATDPLAEQYRSGTGQGYISGDGSYTVVAQEDRGEPIDDPDHAVLLLTGYRVGDECELAVVRGGDRDVLRMRFAELPSRRSRF